MLAANRLGYSFAAVATVFAVFGVIYNVRPIRAKDRAFLDVIVESVQLFEHQTVVREAVRRGVGRMDDPRGSARQSTGEQAEVRRPAVRSIGPGVRHR